MTTIACKDNIMVSDGQMSRGDFIDSYDFEKIVNINGCLVGCAGSVPSILKFRQWFSDNMEAEMAKQDYPFVNITLPEDMVEDDFTALVLYPDGVLYEFFGAQNAMEVKQPAAIGSGMFYATCAMDAGASAEEAVKIAITRDPYSGGDLQVHEIDEIPEPLTEEKFDEMSKEDLKKLLFGEVEVSDQKSVEVICKGLGDIINEVFEEETNSFKFSVTFEDGTSQDYAILPSGGVFDCEHCETFSSFAEDSWSKGALKCVANSLGVKYSHNISEEKLAQRLDEKIQEIVDSMNN